MTDTDTQQQVEQYQQQLDMQTAAQGEREGLSLNQRQVSERKFNPNFLTAVQDPDLKSELHDWLEREFPALFSGAHMVGSRGDHYEAQQELLNRGKAEVFITEHNPGSLLRRHAGLHAVLEPGYEPRVNPLEDDLDSYETYEMLPKPLTSDQMRVVRNAMEVATTRQAVSQHGRGLDAFTTATSETRTVKTDGDSSGGTLSSVREVFS